MRSFTTTLLRLVATLTHQTTLAQYTEARRVQARPHGVQLSAQPSTPVPHRLMPVSSVSSRQHLRSASRGLLVVPRHHLSSYGRQAFSVADPAIWNWLSDSQRDPAISRLLQAFTEHVFIFSLLVYTAH